MRCAPIVETSSEQTGRARRPDSQPASKAAGSDLGREGDEPGNAADDAKSQPRSKAGRPWFRRPRILIAGAIVLAIVVLLGGLWWWYESGFETTTDASIDTHVVNVSPQVAGQVIQVPVQDNQLVQPGQALVVIDPAQYRLALQQALANHEQAQTALGQANANVAVAQASLAQAAADLASTDAMAIRAQQDLKRYQTLGNINARAVARTTVDEAVASARSAVAEQRAAQQRVASARAQIKAAEAAVAGARARIATARAGVQQARLNLGYATVTALISGHVANRTAAIGTYVTPGQQLLAIVPLHLWVTANFKETEIPGLRPGQSATIHIDACPSADARGHVVSIQRGSGEAFALLPPENATGNYIKVVQRVPVRIALDSVPAGCVLGPGMSVEPKVRIR